MPSPSSIFSFKRSNPLAGLLLFALAVLVIETVLAFLPQNTLITALGSIHVPEKSADWQVMGDSVAEGGIRAEQLAASLSPETSVANVAVSASGPEFPYFLLQRQLAAGVAPRAILYAPSPHTFGTRRVALLVGAFATWPEIGEIAASGIEPFEVLYGVLCKLSHSLRHREQLAEVLKGRSTAAEAERAVATGKNPTAEGKETAFPISRVHPMYRKSFTANPFNLHFSQKFLTEARAHNIPVYWLSMPVLEVIRETRAPFHFEDDYQRFLKTTAEQYGATLLMPHSAIFPPANFKDYAHLNAQGASLFTDLLGHQLKQTLPARTR